MNIAALASKAAASHRDRPALRYGGTRLSYGELDEQASRFGTGLLRLGLRPGDRVAIFMRNCPEYVVALFGAFRAGLAVVPINARLHPKELAYIAKDSECAALVFGREHAEAVRSIEGELPDGALLVANDTTPGIPFEAVLAKPRAVLDVAEVAPDSLAWLFYTSGTTGRPKGAILSHRNLERMTTACLASVCSFQPEDLVLHAAPLSHGSGLYLLPSLARGAENLIYDGAGFDPPDVLATIERERVTVVAFVAPTMIVMLLRAPRGADTSSLRRVVYGGAPIHVEHAVEALERFGQIFVQIYGQGESPMTISYLRPQDHRAADPGVLSSAGIPHADVEVRVADADDSPVPAGKTGEVLVRGDVVMPGYWRNEEATAKALRGGWLHTGDVGRIGPDGRLYLLDRKGDVIISGGANVYPREVEEVLLTHPGVREAIVFGVPDPVWGESVAAVVVPDPGWTTSAEELVEHCRSQMASYKKPKRIEFVEALPKNAYGKVLRRELKERARQVSQA